MLDSILSTVGLYSVRMQDGSGVDLYYSLLAVSEQDAIEMAVSKNPEFSVVGVKKPDRGVTDASPAALSKLIAAGDNWLYTVVMFSVAGECNLRDSRCVGLYADKTMAVRLLKENHGDLREKGRYNYAAIEPIGLGFYPHTYNEGTSWYKWSESSSGFEDIPTPEDMEGVCNLGIG